MVEISNKNSSELITLENSTKNAEAGLSVSVDIGNLFAFDPRPVDTTELRKSKEAYLKRLCQQSTQLIVNQLFELPQERVENVIIAKLPKGTTMMPREKPLPKADPMTKWEKYAKMKGIQKKKKSRMVFDEAHNEWRPRWGYGRKNDSTKDWLIEIKKNEDPDQDFFAKRTTEKNERVAKNELQRLRNVARSSKKKVPGVGLTPTIDDKNPDKIELKKALNIAKRSDASLSKFSDKIKNEDKATRGLGKKRKFESNFADNKGEKERQLKIFEKITSNKDKSSKEKLNIEKAVNRHLAQGGDDGDEPKFKKHKAGKKHGSSGKGPRRAPSGGKGARGGSSGGGKGPRRAPSNGKGPRRAPSNGKAPRRAPGSGKSRK